MVKTMFEQFLTLSNILVSHFDRIENLYTFTYTNEKCMSMEVTVNSEAELTSDILEEKIIAGKLKINSLTFRER